jgi:hypothetical protein
MWVGINISKIALKRSKGLSIILLSLLFIQLCILVPNVTASTCPKPTQIPISGSAQVFPGTPISPIYNLGHNLTLVIATQDAIFYSGSFVGNVNVRQSSLSNIFTGQTTIFGVGTFTGQMTANLKTGTFTFIMTGGGITTLYLNWVIIGGTGGLSTLHGSGTLIINAITGAATYSGSVYFK